MDFLSQFGLNGLDLIILAVFAFYAFEGFSVGFVAALIDLFSFVASFVVGLLFYSLIGQFLSAHFSIPLGFSHAIGFFVAAFVSEMLIAIVLRRVIKLLFHLLMKTPLFEPMHESWEGSKRPNKLVAYVSTLNHLFGILPGLISASVLLSFLLTLIVALPLSPYLKKMASDSRFGSGLISNSLGFEKNINNVFGGAINDTLTFMTVEPESNQSVSLGFKTNSGTEDSDAEQKMFNLVNKERVSRGESALTFDNQLQAVALSHAKDMLARGYFSHYTPEGLSPFDRMEQANISFLAAGENLAFAPNTDLAMQGLMASPGHRANILSKDFGKIGVGVIDAGIYGEMFVQEFKN